MPDARPGWRSDAAAWSVGACTAVATTWLAAPAGSWLDAGELIAAARTLGGVHPPGHPGWLSIAALAELLPLGPHAARVAWLSAAFAGLSAACMVRIARSVLPDSSAAGLAWVAALPLAVSASLWQVAVRAEVYTLALATSLWAVEAALRARAAFVASETPRSRAAVVEAGVALCLGLINHHYVALFALPAVLAAGWPALRRTVTTTPRFALMVVALCAWLGAAYVGLALRALADVELRWGDPSTLAGWWDTVTARQFQGSVAGQRGGLADNMAVLLAMVSQGAGTWLPLAGVVGLVLGALRKRPEAWSGMLLLAGALLTKGLMWVDTHNPDDHGYVLAALAGLGVGVALLLGALHGVLATRAVAWSVVAAALVATVLQVRANWRDPACNLAELRATDHLDSVGRRAVAPGALVLTNYFGTQFNEALFRLGEGRRPDWQVAHLSLRTGDTDGGKGFARWWAQRHPDLAVLAQAAQHFGRSPTGNLMTLVETRSVYAEADPANRIPPQYFSFDGPLHRMQLDRERALDYDVEAIRQRQNAVWSRLFERLTATDLNEPATRRVLLWNHALQAAHALRRGWREIGADEVARARTMAPQDRLVDRLALRVATLDAAFARADAKGFAATWQRYATYDFDALVGDAP
ncbi:MAG: DUF2723 domain-containing protein [Deltaproteobacteria bacterium]|nr:DUF2723 domain-containing protein [Deltaproteobacteria bacterium]